MKSVRSTVPTAAGGVRGSFGWPGRSWRLRPSCETITWIAVALGVFLRLVEYLGFRPLYLDEEALVENLVGRSVFDFHQVLAQEQMAPPAFLVIERLLVRLPISVGAAGRFLPLVCGLASLFLMRLAARRYLDPRAVPPAVILLALSDHLIYYSNEIKQYSVDLALALVGLLLAAPPPPALMTRSRWAALGVFGLVAPWLSFPSTFVLGGVGLHLIVSRALRREWKSSALAVAMSGGWVVSFAGCFLLSRSIMSPRRFLWDWWDFAFLPLPPRSLADLGRIGETVANVFINPSGLLSPWSLAITAALASVMALVGMISLGRRWPGGLFLSLSPLLFALLASGLRQYPFHGRLLLFLAPTFLMLPAEGIAAIGRRTHLAVALLLAGIFVYGQAEAIATHRLLYDGLRWRTWDTHGDLKNDLLDYLESQRRPNFHLPAVPNPVKGPGTSLPGDSGAEIRP